MNDTNDLLYSTEASATRVLFYQGLNDINLFVEDAGMEYLYETIFKRLLGANYCISAIYSLGGKTNVNARYREFGDKIGDTPNFYIVDGDFDRYIHKEDMIDVPNFIYLQSYNIENYFIDENATEQFAKGRLKKLDSEIKQLVAFQEWKQKIVSQAKKLFLCYCLVQKLNIPEPTLTRGPYTFIDQKTGYERTDGAYMEYWKHILSIVPTAENEMESISAEYESINGTDYFNFICGKFLLTSLFCHLEAVTKSKLRIEDLKWHLINNFDITKLDYIRVAILSSVSRP